MARWAKVLTTEHDVLRSTTGTCMVEGENQTSQVVFWPSHVCRGTRGLAKHTAHTRERSLGENKLSKQKPLENGCGRWSHTSAEANMAERSTPTNVSSCSIPCLSLEWQYPPQIAFLYRCKKRWPSPFCMPSWWSQGHTRQYNSQGKQHMVLLEDKTSHWVCNALLFK